MIPCEPLLREKVLCLSTYFHVIGYSDSIGVKVLVWEIELIDGIQVSIGRNVTQGSILHQVVLVSAGHLVALSHGVTSYKALRSLCYIVLQVASHGIFKHLPNCVAYINKS